MWWGSNLVKIAEDGPTHWRHTAACAELRGTCGGGSIPWCGWVDDAAGLQRRLNSGPLAWPCLVTTYTCTGEGVTLITRVIHPSGEDRVCAPRVRYPL